MKFKYSDKAPLATVEREGGETLTFAPGEVYDLKPGEFPAFEGRGYLVALPASEQAVEAPKTIAAAPAAEPKALPAEETAKKK